MGIQKFEDLIAWQKAQYLAINIYQTFSEHQDWGFKRQICNAAVSISNNIAEGFDRGSKASFAHFLNIARGSCSEVKSMLYLAGRLHYIQEENRIIFTENCHEISKVIHGLIKSIRNT